MKRFLLSLLYMLMLIPGLVSVAMILSYLPKMFLGPFNAQTLTWSTMGLLFLWTACLVISWSGWRLLRRLYAGADRY